MFGKGERLTGVSIFIDVVGGGGLGIDGCSLDNLGDIDRLF